MKKINREELDSILEKHEMWIKSDGQEGKRANLSGANLSGADLSHVNLFRANLSETDLSHANLSHADLSHANLFGTNLSDANLSGTDLVGANLLVASLYKADLSGADLSGANLSDADLSEADLNNVKRDAITAFFDLQCPEEGSFVGYKKCRDSAIVKILIPEDAKRSSATSRKCRCDKAIVLEIVDGYGDQIETAVSRHDGEFIYKVGETVEVDDFNECRWNECSAGIHFFITRVEAENY